MNYKENIEVEISLVQEEDLQLELGYYGVNNAVLKREKALKDDKIDFNGHFVDIDFVKFVPQLLKNLYPNILEKNSIQLEDIEIVYKRIYGKNHFQISPINKYLFQLKEDFCTEKPKCDICPLNKFCILGRSKMVSHKTIPIIDLFCGAGGLSEGLETQGFSPIFAIDHDKEATNTYVFNRPFFDKKNMFVGDIGDYLATYKVPNAPIVVGGPPCQGFSNANKQSVPDDKRNYLYKKFIEFVANSQAEFVIMENVEGITKFQKFIENDFAEIGFFVKPHLINTKDFGYPQSRKRVFFFGYKTDDKIEFEKMNIIFESGLKKNKLQKKYTLFDAISDLPVLKAKTIRNNTDIENDEWGHTIIKNNSETEYQKLINQNIKNYIFNHRSKYNNSRDIEIYGRLEQGHKSDSPLIADINPYKNRENIFKDKFNKLKYNEHCKTITAHMYFDCHMYIHPTQARGLSPREAARIQGFPDDYFFVGTPNEWYRQIGNAVSPLIARHIGEGLKRAYFSKYEI